MASKNVFGIPGGCSSGPAVVLYASRLVGSCSDINGVAAMMFVFCRWNQGCCGNRNGSRYTNTRLMKILCPCALKQEKRNDDSLENKRVTPLGNKGSYDCIRFPGVAADRPRFCNNDLWADVGLFNLQGDNTGRIV
jgi:hypothetical protein